MASNFSTEPMLEMYLFETSHLVEQLEQIVIRSDKYGDFGTEDINEIFRIMHTIKGSSAMMLFDNIAKLAHSVEDVFFFLRKNKSAVYDSSQLSDLILSGIDFVKLELEKIREGFKADGDVSALHTAIMEYLNSIIADKPDYNNPEQLPADKQQYYISQAISAQNAFQATVYFEDGCEMENVRAYTIVHSLKDISANLYYIPENIIEDDSTASIIKA